MFVRYGTFDFFPWEAGLSVFAEHIRSKRGFKHLQNVRFDIRGEICESDQYDTNARLQQIVNAFSVDGQSCGLVHDDGTRTHHWMPNSYEEPRNLTDVQVFHQRLPETRDGEFVSGRNFELGVSSLYLDPTSEILEYHDTLDRVSNAGPQWRWRRDPRWGFYPYIESPATMQRMFQRGYAIGATRYPLPPAPLYPPPFEDNVARRVKFSGPSRYPNGLTGFRVDWQYTYNLPTFDDITGPTVA